MSDTPAPPSPSVLQSRRRWLTGVVFLGGGQVIALAVGAVATVVLARTLGPAGFGTFSVLSVLVSLGTLVAIFGLDTHLISELTAPEAGQRSYGTVFRLSTEITLALCATGTIVVLATTHGVTQAASLVAIVELALTPFLLGRSVLLARMRQGGAAAVGVANRVALLAGIVVITLLDVSPLLVWAMVVSAVAIAVEVMLVGTLVGAPVGWFHRLGRRRWQLLAACWPLAAAAVAGAAYNRVDQLLLAGFRGRTEVGDYAVAVNVATALSIISAVVYGTTLPGVIEACRRDTEARARRVVEDMALLMFVPGGLGIAMLAGAGGDMIRLLFGAAYPDEHALVAVLAFAELGVFAGTALMSVLIAVDRRRVLLAGVVVALGVNVVLNVLLLHRYGAIAAAWSSLASYAVAAIVPALLAPQARRVARPLLKVTVKTAVAASVGAAVGSTFHALAPALGAASVTYLAATALLFNHDVRRVQHRLVQWRALHRS
jgi:O-antigen/teichoic acid export membrane protein